MQNCIPEQPFSTQPLALLATAFAVGVLSAPYGGVSLTLLISVAGFATLLAFAAFVKNEKWARKKSGARRALIITVVLTLALFLLGATLRSIEMRKVPAKQLRNLIDNGLVAVGEPVELTGVLERDPENAHERFYLQLRLERIRSRSIEPAISREVIQPGSMEREASGVVMLLAPVPTAQIEQEFDQLDLRYGARIRIMSVIERSDSFRNPGVSPFTEYLDRKGYDATGFIKSPLLIERLENVRVFLPLRWLYEWRRKLEAQIDSRFSNETAGVLDAALLGNRYNLSPSTSERFREGGTFHVLVISGLHITFLGGLVFLITRRFTRNALLRFLLSAAVLWAYALAVGAEVSVVRAALMFTVILFAPLVS